MCSVFLLFVVVVAFYSLFFGGGWGGGSRVFEIAQYSFYYVTVLYTQNGRHLAVLFVLNKKHQAVKKARKTGKQ